MRAKFFAGTALVAVVLWASVLPVAAQQQLRQPRPSVEVDWSVLDEMNQPGIEAPQLRAPRGATTLAPPPVGRAPAPLASAPASPVTRAPLVPPTTATAAPPAGNFVPPPQPPTFGAAPPSTSVPVPATPVNPLGDAARATQPPPASAAAAPQPLGQPGGRPPAPTLNSTTAPSAPPPPPPAPAPAAAPAPIAMASAPPPAPSASTLRAPQAIEPAPAPAPVAAVPAPAPVAPVAAPAPAPQVAAAAPAARAATDPLGRLSFAAGSAELASEARTALAPVIGEMNRDAATRLQLQAFASGGDDQGGQARRLSLSRALAVRGYLIEQGIASTRIDVRAMGRASDGPPDRVDLLMVRR